jgi:NADH dehydrogenase FAD-containing subunit
MLLRPFAALPGYLTDWFRHDLEEEPRKQTVAVIGYGWGAHAFVQQIDRRKYNVRVVSTRKERFNQPSMIGSLAASYTAPPRWLPIEQRTVDSLDEVEADYKVIAVGSVVSDFRIPGVRDHCLFCKEPADLEALKTRLPTASGITVMGAGPTGIELAYKLQSLGHRVSILEAGSTVLPGFSSTFQARVTSELEKRGIRLDLQKMITGVSASSITFKDLSRMTNTDLRIWTCGVKPAPLMTGLLVDNRLCVVGKPNVFAIGDCTGKSPPTAQNAEQQGRYLADAFNADFAERPPYKFKELGRALDTTDGVFVEMFGLVGWLPYLWSK